MPFQFVADSRDGFGAIVGPCEVSCCCRQATGVPGETNGWTINYSPWVAPLGGRGLTNPTTIAVTKLAPVDPNASPPSTPDTTVTVPAARIVLRGALLSFAVAIASTAEVGDVYRLTIDQAAMDCDAAFYHHVSCYDIAIVKC